MRMSISGIKILKVPALFPGLKISLTSYEIENKRAKYLDCFYHFTTPYYINTQPHSPSYLSLPIINVNTKVKANFIGMSCGYIKYLKGDNNEEFNIYSRFHATIIFTNYEFHYDEFDTNNYSYYGFDKFEDYKHGKVNLLLGTGIGIEKRVNYTCFFLELDYNQVLLPPNDDLTINPFRGKGIFNVNLGMRILR